MQKQLKPKYLILPARVISRTDGDLHTVTAAQLINLYRVNPAECIVYSWQGYEAGYPDGLVELSSRADGKYLLSNGKPNVT